MIIYSERVCLPDGIRPAYLIEENGRIKAVAGKEAGLKADVDYGNQRIIPGIFDTHNHGTHGYGLSGQVSEDPAVQKPTIRHYLKGLASQGVTSIFPTCAVGMIRSVSEVADEENEGADIVGIHSEGPWLNRVGEKGIKTGWPEVSLDTAKQMVADGQGKLKLVALAPEIPGIDPIIEYFLSQGVTLAYAHSDCTYEEAMAAVEAGASVWVHVYNGMRGFTHREPGMVGAAFDSPETIGELIADGHHVVPAACKVLIKQKTPQGVALITDCMSAGGRPDGDYMLGELPVIVENGTARLKEGGNLAGSILQLKDGVKHVVDWGLATVAQALQMATSVPAKSVGIENTCGSLKAGLPADFIVLDDSLDLQATYVDGRKGWEK